MRGKSSPGKPCREMAAGGSHQGNLEETGPGGDRLKQCSRPGRHSPLSEARMIVRGKVSRTSNGRGNRVVPRIFPSLFRDGFLFLRPPSNRLSPMPGSGYQNPLKRIQAPIPGPFEKDRIHEGGPFMEMTGAEAILACLKAEQVPVVFGYPGGAVLGLYDAIYKTHFPHILTGHEQGAIHAADGYARARERWGYALPPAAPGSATW